jgi:hypothetical protein
VCLADVRGTGETRPADVSRLYSGARTTLAASEGLLGQTLLGSQLRDVRSVLRHLRSRGDLDARRVALWGDSCLPPNPNGRDLAVPLEAPCISQFFASIPAGSSIRRTDKIKLTVVKGKGDTWARSATTAVPSIFNVLVRGSARSHSDIRRHPHRTAG